MRSDWPRIPLPEPQITLRESAALGVEIAALLNPHRPVTGIDTTPLDPYCWSARTI
ncbi:MAG TPA: hypothetical protein VHZ51_28945 [Ktedonobacteraceae bacterium]|nr:hypothetical protein [Ktedonobacteraceae bacterium]